MKGQGTLKEFWRTTYRSGSPVPYIITAQIVVFIVIHLFDLLGEIGVISIPLYDWAISTLGLPATFSKFIQQPWSLVTYPFLHQGLFQILINCLWLYWLGMLFLNFLHARQLLTVYAGAIFLSGVGYLALGQIGYLVSSSPQTVLYTGAVGIAAVLAALLTLVPNTEVRLILIGTVRLRTIGLIYIGIQFAFYLMVNKVAAGAYLLSIGWGWLFMHLLKEGNDLSRYFKKREKRKLKVVHRDSPHPYTSSHYDSDSTPDQEIIDTILDKISSSGYDSLTAQEKETLFRASKQEK